MSNQARELIGQWKRLINEYRKNSRTIARQIIDLVNGLDDDDKIKVIDIFGRLYPIILFLISICRSLLPNSRKRRECEFDQSG